MKQKPLKKKIIRFTIIGAGGMGTIWAKALKKTEGISVQSVVDIDKKRATTLAEEFSGCKVFSSPEQALADKDVDAVIVAVPHSNLASFSRAALRAGKHVLCEKPGGITSSEVTKNQLIAKTAKRIYMIGLNHRFHPAFLKAKEICAKGTIGELLYIRARYGFGGRRGYQKEWRFNKKIAGGGELIDQGIHMLDISQWFLGKFNNIEGFTENFFWGGNVEDNAFVLARTQTGKIAHIHVSWTNWDWIHCVEIFGTKGYLRIDGLDSRYHGPERLAIGIRDPHYKTFPKEKTIIFDKERKEDSLVRELVVFTEAIRKKKIPYPSGEDAAQILSIIEGIYRKNKKR